MVKWTNRLFLHIIRTEIFFRVEYRGGEILKGSIIGTVLEDGELDFVYHHINSDMQVKTGKCHSVPTVFKDGKIQLTEVWE